MRTQQSNIAAMVGRESSSPSLQIGTNENGNSRQILIPLAGSRTSGSGIAFNRVVADVQPQTGPIYDPMAKEDEEKSEKEEEGPVVAVAENSFSGVRKKLLIPAEEALEGARAAAELVMKDALDALQRTKQRLMDILLPHHSASQAPPPAKDEASKVSEAPGIRHRGIGKPDVVMSGPIHQILLVGMILTNSEPVSADEADSEGREKTTEVMHIFSEPTVGFISPLHQRCAEAGAVVQSRL